MDTENNVKHTHITMTAIIPSSRTVSLTGCDVFCKFEALDEFLFVPRKFAFESKIGKESLSVVVADGVVVDGVVCTIFDGPLPHKFSLFMWKLVNKFRLLSNLTHKKIILSIRKKFDSLNL